MSPRTASAQPEQLGQDGTMAIGVERLFGVVATTMTLEGTLLAQPTEISVSSTEITLLANPGSSSPHALPRLAFDYFLAQNISLGAALGYGTLSGDTETRAQVGMTSVSNTTSAPDQSIFTFHLRAGYLLTFNDLLGFWPKLGFSYFTGVFGADPTAGGGEDTMSGYAINLDGALLIKTGSALAFTVAPFADLGLGGSAEIERAGMAFDVDAKVTDFGIMVGLLGWL